MIKLTNASEGFLDKDIYLNPSHIVSMYSQDGKTMIYGGLSGSTSIWTVKESLEDVIDLLNGVKKIKKDLDFPFGAYNLEPIKTEEEMIAIMDREFYRRGR